MAKRPDKSLASQRRAPRQARAKATVSAILTASAQILRRHGLAGLKTAVIAERAGVSVGSLYDYFPSKQAIIIALAREIMAQDVEAVRAAAAAEAGGDRLRAIIATLIARHRTDRVYRRKVMTAHIAAGFATEHAQTVDDAVGALAQTHFPHLKADDAAVFVASRAVLGVCRALVDEGDAHRQDPKAIEDALVGLVANLLAAG